MINEKICIDESAAYPLAEKRFIKTCGFDLETEKHQRMMKMGEKVREDGLDGIRIRALLSFYGPEYFSRGTIRIGDTEISCNYFEQIPQDAVAGIYFYMLTAGECYFSSEENIMDFLYADIWGTNYVDAGIQVLTEEYIRKDMDRRFDGRPAYLSEEFGPGYFGMPVIETKKFFSILDGNQIDVKVKESGLMIPQKTCAGLYLVYNRPDLKAEPECTKCYGNAQGCSFCAVKARRDEVKE
ncbi:MAG: hypothetical protein ACI4LA_09975 [Emergencia sp.]